MPPPVGLTMSAMNRRDDATNYQNQKGNGILQLPKIILAVTRSKCNDVVE